MPPTIMVAVGGRVLFRARCAQASGIVHLAASGEASWHVFAMAIIDGLKSRGVTLAVEQVHPISSEEYPTRGERPRNSRLDLSRLQQVFGITPPLWRDALSFELDRLAEEFPPN